jgi:acetyl/propionyl-CoA carboxylase alpha subunit
VTELVTGVDLVRQQIRIAAGERLAFEAGRPEPARPGHRVPDLCRGSVPQFPAVGRQGPLPQEPKGPGVRHDSGIYGGWEVPVHYDPILAKLIVWAEDRETACRRMAAALDDYVVLGIRTTIPFLRDVVRHPEFAAGRTTTAFIGRHFAEWKEGGAGEEGLRLALAAAAYAETARPGRRPGRGGRRETGRDALDVPGRLEDRRPGRMKFEYLVDGAVQSVSLEKKDGTWKISAAGGTLEAEILRISDNEIVLFAGGKARRVFLVRDGDRWLVSAGGREFVSPARAESGRFHKGDDRTPDGGRGVRSPMPGKVIKLCAAEGDECRKNQTLVIVEAMKMENEVQAGLEGIVKKIHVAVGELVDAEKILVEIEPKSRLDERSASRGREELRPPICGR